MFGVILKIMRVLLCALALPLFAAGGIDGARIESTARTETAAWVAKKRAKAAAILTARPDSSCPLMAAKQFAQVRVLVPAACTGFCLAASHGRHRVATGIQPRQPKRPLAACATAGVVRLLI